MNIRPFRPEDEPAVVALWEQCRLTRPWNDPRKDIARKLEVQPELFLVGEVEATTAVSAMRRTKSSASASASLRIEPW